MKKIFLLMTVWAVALGLKAQDTISFTTLTFDSTTRSGYFDFPDTNVSFRKILMQYTIRCHDALVGNANWVGCYEWDYSCNTAIVDSSMLDSLHRTSPSHVISSFSGTSFPISFAPTYTFYQYDQQEVIYASTLSETVATVGAGGIGAHDPFGAGLPLSKSQFLFSATELAGAGLSAGNITSLRMDLQGLGSSLNFLRVRIKPTTKTALDPADVDLAGFTEVYFLNTTFGSTGWQNLNFHTPFPWNGTDNLLVEFSFKNAGTGTDNIVASTNTFADNGLIYSGENYAMSFSGAGQVDADPSALGGISNEITVAFWAYGASNLPQNTTVFEGTDATGNRQVNVHLPWSDGNLYWDCGNDGTGYDRINGAISANDYKNRWTYWTFTKNATTGDMKVYIDGQLALSGTGKTKAIDLQNLRIGGGLTGVMPYYGKVDEFAVWNAELDQATVQAWMHQSLNASHPFYGNLLAYYPFNEGIGAATADASPTAGTGSVENGASWYALQPLELFHNFQLTQERPNTRFVSGTYTYNNQTHTVLDSILNPQHSVTEYTVVANDLVEVGTNLYYQAGWQYTYDTAGVAVDSVLAATDSTINITTLDYYLRAPMALELLSMVTPYGNGLDLGVNGAMWEFDVTDFAPVLKGPKYLYMYYGGEFQEEIKIKFLYITGTPPRDVHSIQQVWPLVGRMGWSNDYNSIKNDVIFEPRQLTLDPASSMYKLRSAITGHGQEGEFIQRLHWLNIDGGAKELEWLVWKECSEIPIYPQGGTWLYDRAGWCPGTPTDLKELDFSSQVSPGQTITLDYGLNNASGIGDSRYLAAHQLVSYGAPNFSLDAAIFQVKRPSTQKMYARYNPACNEPVVIIRNEGATPLTSLDITYNVRGGTPVTYPWTGNLDFLESAEVELPVAYNTFWTGSTANVFEVQISNPNGGTDEYADNDVYYSPFTGWDNWTGNLAFNWRTNNKPGETSWKLYNESGTLVAQNTPFLGANITYNESLTLAPGCYTLRIDDTGDDGLYYWALTSQGAGFFKLMQDGSVVKTFQREFGGFIQYDFHCDGSVGMAPGENPRHLTVFPNPTQGDLTLQLEGYEGREVQIQVFNLSGALVLSQDLSIGNQGSARYTLGLNGMPAGSYLVKVWDGMEMSTHKIELVR